VQLVTCTPAPTSMPTFSGVRLQVSPTVFVYSPAMDCAVRRDFILPSDLMLHAYLVRELSTRARRLRGRRLCV
jgi:hypothetical protein